MATEVDDIELKHAVSKIAFGARKPDKAAYGVILSVTECQALWGFLSELNAGFWRIKEKDSEAIRD